MNETHPQADDPFVFDGLVVANWGPDVFNALRAGGVSAINATCALWENARQTMDNVARWIGWFDEFSDLILPVRQISDLELARSTNRTGVVLGFQNLSPIEDQLSYIGLYKTLGVGVMQLCYNTTNLIGSGSYESRDSGLTDFGREVIAEMNRVGVAIDLSHVGERTADDAIAASTVPVVMSHVLPKELKEHPRNKSWAQLKAVVDRGGLVSVTMFPAFLPKGPASTVDDYAAAIDLVVDHCGEDNVGFGTDFTEGQPQEFLEWLMRDKGYARTLTDFGAVKNPAGIETIAETSNLIAALERREWTASRIEKVIGGNWLQYLATVWARA
ncbi:MAG: rane dipeptidase [Chloroflexota bacterium]|nr:rane dipeptidase [Chloroflexota bacterium]